MHSLFTASRTRSRGRRFVRPDVEALEDRTLLAGGLPYASVEVGFTIGRMVADQVRNLVYMGDQTHAAILAVDTAIGRTTARRELAGTPSGLAISIEGDRLFVAEPEALQIEVLSLPNLTSLATIPVGTAVYNLVVVVNDSLIVSSDIASFTNLVVLNAQTGQVTDTIGNRAYYSPLLRTDAAGTKLYVHETSLSGFSGAVDEYDLSGGPPITLTNSYPVPLANSQDYVVDESARRIYTADGGVYGVGMTDMDSKVETVWPYVTAPYGIAVAALPSGPVYGASGDGIFEFNTRGAIQNRYPSPRGVMGESLKITPNGHLLYANNLIGNSGVVSIIGVGSLEIEDRPIARFAFETESDGRVAFDASASFPGLSGQTLTGFAWDFGDGTIGSGMNITHSFSVVGPVAVRLTVTNSDGQSSVLVMSMTVTGGPSSREISGRVLHDFGSDTLPLRGRIVYLDANRDGKLNSGESRTTTDSDGRYAFSELTLGVVYHVRVVVPRGWVATTPTLIGVITGSGGHNAGNDFGIGRPVSIRGSVFDDHNRDGWQGRHDGGLSDWTVFLDQNGNGAFDFAEVSTRTEADGRYRFRDLAPGTYYVRAIRKAKWESLVSLHTISLSSGESAAGQDFSVSRT